jgi:hypothetical protein
MERVQSCDLKCETKGENHISVGTTVFRINQYTQPITRDTVMKDHNAKVLSPFKIHCGKATDH